MQAFSNSYAEQATLAGYLPADSAFGRLYYLPEDLHRAITLFESPVPQVFQSRSLRPHRIHIARVSADAPRKKAKRTRRNVSVFFGKLAGSKSNAKRLLRSFIGSTAAKPHPVQAEPSNPVISTPRRPISWAASPSESSRTRRSSLLRRESKRNSEAMRPFNRHSVAGPIGAVVPRTLVPDNLNQSTPELESFPNSSQRIPDEKPVASGNGISVSISLAEPTLFVQGFDHSDLSATRSTAMLRGLLHIKIAKAAKIKAISLKFNGTAVTKWPEGIPPKKSEFEEVNNIMSHTWPFFNAQFAAAEHGYGADHVELQHKALEITNKRASIDVRDLLRISTTGSSPNLSREAKRASLHVSSIRSSSPSPTVAQKGYKLFQPGDYVYNFELPFDSHLPESIDAELGCVSYTLEATVERSGTFKGKIAGTKEVKVIRTPAEGSLEQVEPIAIARNWDEQLHYDVVISGKSFPLGTRIPIAFKLTPLSKVQLHKFKIYITESVEYFCSNKRVHRTEPAKRMLLFEKRSDGPAMSTFEGSTMRIVSGGGVPYDHRAAAARGECVPGTNPDNLLGNLDRGEGTIGPTEMEVNVQLPTCQAMARDKSTKLHFDTSYANIQVHHWIKIVLRLSKTDASDPKKRRHFEISIDSPFHILSCRATQSNIFLPAYSEPQVENDSQPECCCPGATIRLNSPTSYVPTISTFGSGTSSGLSPTSSTRSSTDSALQTPPTAHLSNGHSERAGDVSAPRPMHIIRVPSYNPPAFDAEEPPPPIETPPPQYDSIANPTTGLADYFARLSDAYTPGEVEEEDDGATTPRARGSVVLQEAQTSEVLATAAPHAPVGNWI